MKPKLKEKRIVQKLRRQGLGYNEILQKVPVAKSSISLWCRNIKLTSRQKRRLEKKWRENLRKFAKFGHNAIRVRREKEINKIRRVAKKQIRRSTLYEFKIVGAMLYWAEGSKGGGVEITNSDPKLIKFMVRWLKEVCKVSPKRLKARLNIHANQNDKKIKKYWSRITGISLTQFGKSYIKPEGTGHRKNILHNGVIRVRFGSEDLRHKIMTWIKVLYQQSCKSCGD